MLVELNEKEFEMITAFRRIFMNENEVIEVEHIDKDNYKEYIGKTVKVTGNVNLRDLGLTKIPINFTEVGGYFDCSFNELTSLEGAPKVVFGGLYCWPQQLDFIKRGAKKSGFPFFRLFK
jgi:hypothetical protein